MFRLDAALPFETLSSSPPKETAANICGGGISCLPFISLQRKLQAKKLQADASRVHYHHASVGSPLLALNPAYCSPRNLPLRPSLSR